LVNGTTDIDLSGVPSSGSNPYGEYAETADRPPPRPKMVVVDRLTFWGGDFRNE
jgi:hypothetical protein